MSLSFLSTYGVAFILAILRYSIIELLYMATKPQLGEQLEISNNKTKKNYSYYFLRLLSTLGDDMKIRLRGGYDQTNSIVRILSCRRLGNTIMVQFIYKMSC